jgi:nitrate reductase NapE component
MLAARTMKRPPAEPGALPGLPRPRTPDAPPMRRPGRELLVHLLAGVRDSCALAAVALLGCLAVVAVGTIGSLLWMFLLER